MLGSAVAVGDRGLHAACTGAGCTLHHICHALRSARGSVKDEKPDQKLGFFCLFHSQISCSEGKLVGYSLNKVGISDSVLESNNTGCYVTQLQKVQSSELLEKSTDLRLTLHCAWWKQGEGKGYRKTCFKNTLILENIPQDP